MPPLSEAQVEEFVRDGCTTVDCGLSDEQLDFFEAAHDADEFGPPHPAFFEFVAHPVFEAIAQQILRSDNVRILESGPNKRPPADEPEREWQPKHGFATQWANGMHCGVLLTSPSQPCCSALAGG